MNMKDRLAKAYGTASRPAEASVAKKDAPRPDAENSRTKASIPPIAPAGKHSVKSRQPGTTGSREGLIKAAEASERFIKTGVSGTEKAAKFLLLLGQEEAAKVIRHFKPAEIEKISREIAKIDRIETTEANQILTEFGWLAKTQGANLEGGAEIAERMLAAAFGPEKAKEVLRKAVPESNRPFVFLNDFDARQLIVLLKDESPQVMAMILPHLQPKLASSIISELPKEARTDVVRRIARLDRMAPDIIERVEAVLRDRIARIGRQESGDQIDGASVLAGILKHVGGGLEDSILSGIEEDNPELSRDIRERLFTADDIHRVGDRDVQKGLRDMSERDVALVLKGKSQTFRDKLLANVSQSKRTIILEEYEIMGTVRRDEVEKATRSFLEYFKRRWEAGDLVLEGDEDLID
jgi:flagellar motor switch protein FliG